MDIRYRAYVGPADKYDLLGANQFNLLTEYGLRENQYLLDFGCGSLCAGRLFISYLLPGRYHGIEPFKWLIDEGIEKEMGMTILDIKKPVFSYNDDFNVGVFNKKFDFILAHSIFTHASYNQVDTCLSSIRDSMHNNSLFFSTFIVGEKDYYEEGWIYDSFTSYNINTIKELFSNHSLKFEILDYYHPIGQKWFLSKAL